MANQKVDLIRQALNAAESSIKLAKQLLNDIDNDGAKIRPPAKEVPGVLGTFDGQELLTAEGEKYPVPENYASKSILVVGDTLKLVEEGKDKRFKQIEHVKRHKTTGILTKKDGKWTAVTPEGSYKLLPAAVAHFSGGVGDEALLQLPATNLQVPWAAVERVTKKADGGTVVEKKEDSKEQKANPSSEPKQQPKSESKAHAIPQIKKEGKVSKPEPKVEKKEEPKTVAVTPPVEAKPEQKQIDGPKPLEKPLEEPVIVTATTTQPNSSEEEEELA